MFDRSLMIEVWRNAPLRTLTCSAASQLGNEDTATQRLIQQCDSPSGAGKPSPLFQPRLGGGLRDVWLDELTQGRADLGQSPLRRFVLTVDEMSGELCQHHGMVAKHAIGTKVCRTAVQQVCDCCRLPTRRSWRADLARPARRYVRCAHN